MAWLDSIRDAWFVPKRWDTWQVLRALPAETLVDGLPRVLSNCVRDEGRQQPAETTCDVWTVFH